jgi:choline dehydrogenase-like flavoprotein
MLSGAHILSERFQVCIIGAGPVGISIALWLGRSGVKTLLVDKGPVRPRAPRRPGGDLSSKTHASDRDTLAYGLGGTTSRWGGRCVRLDDLDFERRDYVTSAAWPIAHGDIKKFYYDACNVLGCPPGFDRLECGEDDFVASPESWAFPRNIAIANRTELIASRTVHIVLETQVTDVRLDRETSRILALGVVHKSSPSNVYADQFVIACGGRENARLLLNLQADVPRLFGGQSGPLGKYYMGHLTGQISKIRFCSGRAAETFLVQRHGKGCFTSNRLQPSASTQRCLGLLNLAMWPHNPDIGKTPSISPAASAAFFREVAAGKRKVLARESLSHAAALARHPASAAAASVAALKAYYRDGLPFLQLRDPDNEYHLRYHSEQLPRASNQVRLSDRKDEFGQRHVEPLFGYCENDCRSVVSAHHALDKWLRERKLGVLAFSEGELGELVASQATDGYHQIGLTRMGRNREEGVVDLNSRVFDLGNLYVAGSSVFVTSGQANPTLPAVAFGARLAQHLATIVTSGKFEA